jgi:hypothetical protein
MRGSGVRVTVAAPNNPLISMTYMEWKGTVTESKLVCQSHASQGRPLAGFAAQLRTSDRGSRDSREGGRGQQAEAAGAARGTCRAGRAPGPPATVSEIAVSVVSVTVRREPRASLSPGELEHFMGADQKQSQSAAPLHTRITPLQQWKCRSTNL